MKILIIGGSGQLGRALRGVLTEGDVEAPTRGQVDLLDLPAVRHSVEWMQFGKAINCAAMTNTTECERSPELARNINARAAGNLALACAQSDVTLVHISTNEVFDGTQDRPYEENDLVSPANAYGRTKVEGEQLVTSLGNHTAIVRAAWLYGDGGENFVEKVLAAARAGRPLRFVTDEIATPTSALDLAEAIRALIEVAAPAGVYHLTNEGEASRYEWAREIVRLAGFDESRVEPITTEELGASGYGGPRKPAYSVLANTRARALGITLRPWREALAAHFERARVGTDG